jgi:hypothetical protein
MTRRPTASPRSSLSPPATAASPRCVWTRTRAWLMHLVWQSHRNRLLSGVPRGSWSAPRLAIMAPFFQLLLPLALQLAARVEEAVRAHQNSDLNVALSQAMAAMLDKVSAPPPLMPVLFNYVHYMALWVHLPSPKPPAGCRCCTGPMCKRRSMRCTGRCRRAR